ncbi:MAG: hypothetical protein AAFX05_02415 [Planctomycetota bacterium]
MSAKLAALIVAFALTAVGLLAVRQQRLQAVSDMASSIERAAEMDRQSWRLRVEVARRLDPDALQRAVESLGDVSPLQLRECEIICPPEDEDQEPAHVADPGRVASVEDVDGEERSL